MSKRSYFRGRSTSSILNMGIDEFVDLSKSQLREAVSRIADTANKRMKSLQKAGLPSAALREAQTYGGRFTTRGKGLDELRAEFLRAKDFINAPSSTVKGARSILKQAEKAVKDIYGEDIPNNIDIQRLIDDYNNLQNEDVDYIAQKLRYGHLYDSDPAVMSDNQKSAVVDLSHRIAQLLERRLGPGGMDYDGVSQWFDL